MQKNVLICVLLLYSISCLSTNKKFQKLEKENENIGILYLMRRYSPLLALFDFDIEIYQYKGHFKNHNKIKIYELELKPGEFAIFYLQEGFYEIIFPYFSHYNHIFYITKKQVLFKNIEIYSKSFFSLPDIIITDLTKEKAVEYLLESGGMFQNQSINGTTKN
ncbi:MAG: hypothetical protein KatS3mg129_2153 [Leptospiraceae bacterium]|nr:MAG: hypothetical protein KatS3mg129_2153 [Leptospiraceae bacterium]